MPYPNNPNQFEPNPKLDKLGHVIEIFYADGRASERLGFAASEEKQIFWDEVIARNGYTEDKQVLWMCSKNLYSKPYYWVNRDLTVPRVALAEYVSPESSGVDPKSMVRAQQHRKVLY